MSIRIINGDMLVELPLLEPDSIDACVTDPPYHLTNNTGSRSPYPGQYTPIGRPKAPKGGFMGKTWDGGDVALRPETWEAVWRVLKPGAHLLAFGGTRTFHRLACAIEDAGFEIRDTIAWMYGSGFPKSLDVSKAIDKAAGATREVVGVNEAALRPNRINHGLVHSSEAGSFGPDNGATITAPATPEAEQWSGWGTALKPAMELICVARKPLGEKTVAANVLRYGTGAVNVDGSRIEAIDKTSAPVGHYGGSQIGPTGHTGLRDNKSDQLGRWPANVVHDGSEEVMAAFPETISGGAPTAGDRNGLGWGNFAARSLVNHGKNEGSAARFFYTAKADSFDRSGSKHPTVKPTDLMRWLVKLVTPPAGTVLDPFCGTGSTLLAADQLQFHGIGIEQDATYAEDARRKFTRDAGLFADLASF